MKNKLFSGILLLALILSACGAPTVQPTATTYLPGPPATPASTGLPAPGPTPAPTLAATLRPTSTSIPAGPAIVRFPANTQLTLTQARLFPDGRRVSGWAVAENRSADPNTRHLLHSVIDSSGGVVDDGTAWHDVTPPETVAANPGSAIGPLPVFFLDSQRAWLAFSPVGKSAPLGIWRTADGGATWRKSAALDLGGDIGPDFLSPGPLTFLPDGKSGWLIIHAGVGMNHDYIYIFSTADGGQTWQRLVAPQDAQNSLIMSCAKNGLGFADAANGWLAGDCGGVAPGVLLFRTRDGGASWEAAQLPAPAGQADLFTRQGVACAAYPPAFLSPSAGFLAVGCKTYDPAGRPDQAWLFATSDGGATWTPRIAPAPLSLNNSLNPADAFQFLDNGMGWFVGAGQVFQTRDSGRTWASIAQVNWQAALNFVTSSEGWAVAASDTPQGAVDYALVHTATGGKLWNLLQPKLAP